jgi:hypothetical protein
MNPLSILTRIPTIAPLLSRSAASSRRLEAKSRRITTLKEILEVWLEPARTTTAGWVVCAHKVGAQFLVPDAEKTSHADWIEQVQFPTAGEGYCPKQDLSWNLVHLGPAGWEWTTVTSQPDQASILTTEILIGRNNRQMLYEVCHAPVDLGDHSELRPIAQRFVGFN